jgi:mono/diheme cytochrome c family protein
MKPDRKKGQSTPQREVHSPQRSRADDPEPSTGNGGLPVWLFVILAALLFGGMVYLDNHAGGFNPVVYRPYTSSNELVKMVPFDPAQKDFLAGLAVYNRPTCGACHQQNGQGTAGLFPPLAGSEWVLEKDPARVIRIVLDGVAGPMTVKGAAYNNAMPGWAAQLNDEEIAQVITYIRKAWGNTAGPVKAEEVAAVRKETSGRGGMPWTAEDLLKVPLKP